MSIAELQKFLRHDQQRTTEIYAGFLETDTRDQTEFLAEFWSDRLE